MIWLESRIHDDRRVALVRHWPSIIADIEVEWLT